MSLADDAALAEVPPEDLEGARTSYEAYCRVVGVAPRWATLPVRLQLGWVEARRTARQMPSAVVAPGAAEGPLRCG